MEVTIRRAVTSDARAIAHVHTESWRWAYRDIMSAEVLANLDVERRAAGWERALQPDGDTTTWVAEADREVVGFISVGPAQGDGAQDGAVELLAIYLVEDYARRGIGKALMDTAETHWRGEAQTYAVLRVAEANAGTRAFYEANGWRAVGPMETHPVSETEEVDVVRYEKHLSG